MLKSPRLFVAGLAGFTIFLGTASTALACDTETLRIVRFAINQYCDGGPGWAFIQCTESGAEIVEMGCD